MKWMNPRGLPPIYYQVGPELSDPHILSGGTMPKDKGNLVLIAVAVVVAVVFLMNVGGTSGRFVNGM